MTTRKRDVTLHAPRGSTLTCRGWVQEAALRMLHNNLDPEVAENPHELVVYGGIGRAARNWECFDAIVATLRRLACCSRTPISSATGRAGIISSSSTARA